jgi:hypothetical protein
VETRTKASGNDGQGPARAPRFLDQVRVAARRLHYSIRTEEAFAPWVKRFVLFHGKRHPAEMGEADVVAFLDALAVDRHVAASTRNQALAALLFLHKVVLDRPLERLGGDMVRARRPERLPVVLTRDEIRTVLAQLDGTPWLMASLLYGSGLRLLECLRLRIDGMAKAAAQKEHASNLMVVDLMRSMERAELSWDSDRREYIENLGARLSRDPSRAASALERTNQGAAYTLQHWERLRWTLQANKVWSDELRPTALDLLGIELKYRADNPVLPPDADVA